MRSRKSGYEATSLPRHVSLRASLPPLWTTPGSSETNLPIAAKRCVIRILQRRYASCLFSRARRRSSMAKSMEPKFRHGRDERRMRMLVRWLERLRRSRGLLGFHRGPSRTAIFKTPHPRLRAHRPVTRRPARLGRICHGVSTASWTNLDQSGPDWAATFCATLKANPLIFLLNAWRHGSTGLDLCAAHKIMLDDYAATHIRRFRSDPKSEPPLPPTGASVRCLTHFRK